MNSSTITFNNIPKGNYAVFILHDENKNGKIDADDFKMLRKKKG